MLDMGFQPQVDAIVKRLPRKRQTMFFSATLDGEVGELARAYTFNPSRYDAELPSHLESGETDHKFISVTPDNKVETLVELLKEERGLVLVFIRTKRGADRLVQKLKRHEIQAVAMHGDMSQNARERALSRFESGKVQTLVATDVAARGLDLDDITHVINFDPPEDDKGYTHRVGRTAQGRPRRHGHHARPAGAAGGRLPRRPQGRRERPVRGPGHADGPAAAGLLGHPAQPQVGRQAAPPQDLAENPQAPRRFAR